MNIKKILALVLALVMVACMVAACGDVETTTESTKTTVDTDATTKATDVTTKATDATTKATDATTKATDATTKATDTTTEAPKPEAPAQAVVYIPVDLEPQEIVCNYRNVTDAMMTALYETAESVEAVNIATGEKVTVKNVTRGHLYLVKTDDGTVVTDLGEAMKFAAVNRFGKKDSFTDAALMTGIKSGTYAYYFDDIAYLVNNISVDKVNAALADYAETVGSFGTMNIIDVTDDAITAMMGDKEVNVADLKVRFVYVTYLGDELKEATEDYSVFGLKTNTVDNIAVAEDETNADGQGSTAAAWKVYNPSGSQLIGNGEDPDIARMEAVPTWYLYRTNSALNKEGLSVVEKSKAQKAFDSALAKYEEFVGYYEEAVNCKLWGDDIADSPVKEYWDAATAALGEDETVTGLSYTYYYDVATDTYVVFVTDNTPGSLVYGTYLNYYEFKASPEYPEA